jgi:c-di-GMP-binding flagellar brake protein YcgR
MCDQTPSLFLSGLLKLSVGGDQGIECKCSIQPARVRQNPNVSVAKFELLPTPRDQTLIEDSCERRLSEKSKKARAETPHLSFQNLSRLAKLMAR